MLHDEGLDFRICEKLNIWTGAPNLEPWRKVAESIRSPGKGTVRVAMIGKYVELTESYKSLHEAVRHGAVSNDCAVEIAYVDSEAISQDQIPDDLRGADAVLVLPGFGKRGGEGKVEAVRYAREAGVPFLGICLGMQMAVVEFARNVLGIENAASAEFDPDSPEPVIHLMEGQKKVADKGGSMRLGAYPCDTKEGSRARKIYGKKSISERHRHRFEVNNSYRERMEDAGMIMSGVSPDNLLVEIVEIKNHPWYVAVQFHPEFQSGPLRPHPLFHSFIEAALEYRDKKKNLSGKIEVEGGESEHAADSDSAKVSKGAIQPSI